MPVHLCSMSKRRGKARNILGPLLCLHYIDLISYSHIIFVNLIEFESESSISSNKWPAACRRCPGPPGLGRQEKPGSEPFNQLAELKLEPVPRRAEVRELGQ